jgi:hypothetical protein
MDALPEPVQRFTSTILKLPGVREASVTLRSLEGLDERTLSFPGEFADLPHAAIRRTPGGLPGEFLVTAEILFTQDYTGWIALEFLAWWVRDLSRSGHVVQMRPLALPPVAYGTQLGRTLKFAIEFFLVSSDGDKAPLLAALTKAAESLDTSLQTYAKTISKPTLAEPKDIDSFLRAAENDDCTAQYRLALAYFKGKGAPRDGKAALTWFERAAKWGHPQAMFYTALLYDQGDGIAQNHAKAFEWYSKAAEKGVPLAMGCLAQAYETGTGTTLDLAKAVEWYRRGADQNDGACQAQLGECYELGKGVKMDRAEALRWYEAALKSGFNAVQPAIDRLKKSSRP